MRRLTKVLSLALATVIAVSTFTISTFAASRADEHKRDLTADEITAIASIFDAEYYASAYPDVVDTLGTDDATTMLTHFLSFGIWEERQPSASFNVDVYATRNVDLQQAYGDDIIAYYVYYASHVKEQSWRAAATLADAYRNEVTIYSVYDYTVGQIGPNAGAYAIQTTNYAPNLGITGTDATSNANRAKILGNY